MPDFNNAGPQRSFDVIPSGTIATLHLTVRPGNAGENGWLRRSKAGDSEALDCEFALFGCQGQQIGFLIPRQKLRQGILDRRAACFAVQRHERPDL